MKKLQKITSDDIDEAFFIHGDLYITVKATPFQQACVNAVKQAKEIGVVFFVCGAPTHWHVTATYCENWLFKAYPGGRTVLSLEGTKVRDVEATKF